MTREQVKIAMDIAYKYAQANCNSVFVEPVLFAQKTWENLSDAEHQANLKAGINVAQYALWLADLVGDACTYKVVIDYGWLTDMDQEKTSPENLTAASFEECYNYINQFKHNDRALLEIINCQTGKIVWEEEYLP